MSRLSQLQCVRHLYISSSYVDHIQETIDPVSEVLETLEISVHSSDEEVLETVILPQLKFLTLWRTAPNYHEAEEWSNPVPAFFEHVDTLRLEYLGIVEDHSDASPKKPYGLKSRFPPSSSDPSWERDYALCHLLPCRSRTLT